jgi:hypothetical protein
VAVAVVDAAVSSSGVLDVEMGLRKLGMPPGEAGAAAASAAQRLTSSAMAPFQGTALCQLPPAEQALVPSASRLTAVELPMQTVMTLTLTGTLATFDTVGFKERLAARLQLQVQQIRVQKKRPKSFVVGTSANAVDGIAVEVDEDNYLRSIGSGSLSDGSEASEDDSDYISSAIRVALKPITVPAKDAITIEWVEAGSVIVCITLPLPLAIILMDLHRLRDPELEALGLRSHVIGEQRKVAPPSQAELAAFDDVIRGIIFAPNHFEALGLPLSAAVDSGQLKKAYKALSRQVHPDKNPYDDDEAAAAADAVAAAEATAAAEEAAVAAEAAAASEGAGEQSQPAAADEPPSKKPRVAEELEAPAEVVAPHSKLGAEPAQKRLNEARRVLSDPVEAARHLQDCQEGTTLGGAWEQDALEELRQLQAAHMKKEEGGGGGIRLIQFITMPDPALGTAGKSLFPHMVELNGALSAEDEACEWQQCKSKTTCIEVQLQDEKGAPQRSSRLNNPKTTIPASARHIFYQCRSLCLWQASLFWVARCRRAAWSFR